MFTVLLKKPLNKANHIPKKQQNNRFAKPVLTLGQGALVRLRHSWYLLRNSIFTKMWRLYKNLFNVLFSENFVNFAQKKAEFANLFSLSKEEKFPQKNGEICPNFNTKKVD